MAGRKDREGAKLAASKKDMGASMLDMMSLSPKGDITFSPGQDDDGRFERVIRSSTGDVFPNAYYEADQVPPGEFQSLPALPGSISDRRGSRYSAGLTFKMEKRYGLFSSICIIICVVIGSGIFINPQDVVKNTRRPGTALILWFFMGFHSTIGALCFAELGTTLPVSGGDYAYLNEAFGSCPGFLYQWCSSFLFIPAVNAIFTKTLITYFLDMIFFYYYHTHTPSVFHDEVEVGDGQKVKRTNLEYDALRSGLEVLLILGVIFGNCFSTKFAEKGATFFTIAKLSACTMIVIIGIVAIAQTGKTATPLDSAGAFKLVNQSLLITDFDKLTAKEQKELQNPDALVQAFGIGAGIYDIFFSYLGWTYLNYITEELENPYRNLPIAICVAIPLITAIYCLMNVMYLAILPINTYVTTNVIATDALEELLSDKLKMGFYWVAPFVVIISAFGALIGHTMACSRVLFVAPRFGHAPVIFNHIHAKRLTPIPSLVLQAIMSVIFIIIQNFTLLILMAAYCETSFTSLSICGLIYLRFKKPDMERPIKFWIGLPILFTFISIILILIPIATIIGDWNNPTVQKITVPMVAGTFAALLTGLIVYILFVRHKFVCIRNLEIDRKLEAFISKVFNTKRAS